ncbi:MAG: helix-hairpin-helix domain-containing protein, partial [Firmicutes bacterium]|nr:helix-hairpin-helix domain-containing protein [Bacillota bacterium]
AIVDYREKNGPFKSIEELVHVSGIGAKTLESLRELVTVN